MDIPDSCTIEVGVFKVFRVFVYANLEKEMKNEKKNIYIYKELKRCVDGELTSFGSLALFCFALC